MQTSKTNTIIFWGATGQAKVLREHTDKLGYKLLAVFDGDSSVTSPFPDVPLFHGMPGFLEWKAKQNPSHTTYGLIAIGGSFGKDRVSLQQELETHGIEFLTVVHESAFFAASAKMGAGSQVLANAAVCAEATLGLACIVNTAASVDHECRLGDGVHIAPGATIAGCVEIGDFSMVGAGAVVLPRIKIGKSCIVGAGSVVTKDVPDGTIVYGVPAAVSKNFPKEAR